MGRRLLIAMALCFFSQNLWATYPQEYCRVSADMQYFKDQAPILGNHLAVRNHGGLFNGGVCWWHSLFQRAALYLTTFNPLQPRPNEEQINDIVHALAVGRKVIQIPGYKNILEFSQANWPAIQRQLEQWQLVDGFLKQAWIKSLFSTWHIDPKELKQTMDELYSDVEIKKEIVWVMLKFKKFGAHAWLVINMEKRTDGYLLTVIDSNYPTTTHKIEYKEGSQSLQSGYGPTGVFLGRQSFFRDFKVARQNYCGRAPLIKVDLRLYNGWE